MIAQSFDNAFILAQTSSYFLIFILMVFEGPVITTAAAFASSLGFLNIWIIFFLSLLGDLVGDFMYFLLGKGGRMAVIEKFEGKIGFKRISKLERNIKNHFGKTLLAIKFTPLIGGPGLMLTGALKIPIKRFLFYSFIITLPRTIFFTALGFYFGLTVNSVLKYLKLGEYALLFILIAAIIVYIVYKKLFEEVSKELLKV
ncbi:MAG: VTT domain-containing protein [Candidatus Nanoarchaeia archaeon]|nr:VTT domain-containing protein [Candidatus Nanoarchaeia archaeon]MDD5740406.1 VTT domain-containing protein [Candidatus Nanoarchaeia archaeon]